MRMRRFTDAEIVTARRVGRSVTRGMVTDVYS